jgi:tetratricopeptide (TPR) repeat protein
VVFAGTGCGKLRARDQLNKGVTSYKNAKYEEAIGHFQQAVSLDPSLIVARLYLATAYAQQYVPGVGDEDNLRMANQAIQEYLKVIDTNPPKEQHVNSIKGIAYLYLNMKNFDEAKKYYRMAEETDPNDPEPYYSVGVIDWTQSYQPRMEERAKLGLRPDEPLKDKKVCSVLNEKGWAIIQDGLDNLDKALQIRPDYDDAMAYMNLLYREKADLECDDPSARSSDLRTADDWVDKTLAVKKAKADKQPGAQGIVLDQSK